MDVCMLRFWEYQANGVTAKEDLTEDSVSGKRKEKKHKIKWKKKRIINNNNNNLKNKGISRMRRR